MERSFRRIGIGLLVIIGTFTFTPWVAAILVGIWRTGAAVLERNLAQVF